MEHNRRADDERVDALVSDVAVLKTQMLENTKVTMQVRDILGTFRVTAIFSKWLVAIAASAVAIYMSLKGK